MNLDNDTRPIWRRPLLYIPLIIVFLSSLTLLKNDFRFDDYVQRVNMLGSQSLANHGQTFAKEPASLPDAFRTLFMFLGPNEEGHIE